MTKARPELRVAVRGEKNGTPFEIHVPNQEEAKRIADDFESQGAEKITITDLD